MIMIDLKKILAHAIKENASDIHLKVGSSPLLRCDGVLFRLAELPPIKKEDCETILNELLTGPERKKFATDQELDKGIELPGFCRLRVNLSIEQSQPRIIFRLIPFSPLSLKELNLPAVLEKIAQSPRGLVLVTGETGVGKTTTLATMIDCINTNFAKHIITIEDPIEFLHQDKKSIVTQREIGTDTKSFVSSLRYILRQDPDVILIGEMRDLDTAKAAISAAETGHLVLSTLHTNNSTETINRIIDIFPPNQQPQVRKQLAAILVAVICQRLVLKKDGSGRIPAVEILISTALIKEKILKNQLQDIPKLMEEGKIVYGMQTFDLALLELVKGGQVSEEVALAASTSPTDFSIKLKGFAN